MRLSMLGLFARLAEECCATSCRSLVITSPFSPGGKAFASSDSKYDHGNAQELLTVRSLMGVID